MTNRQKVIVVDDMIESRMCYMAIDAKYMKKRDFYYKVYGVLEGMTAAIIWISDLNDVTIEHYRTEIARMREDLDAWYYRTEM